MNKSRRAPSSDIFLFPVISCSRAGAGALPARRLIFLFACCEVKKRAQRRRGSEQVFIAHTNSTPEAPLQVFCLFLLSLFFFFTSAPCD